MGGDIKCLVVRISAFCNAVALPKPSISVKLQTIMDSHSPQIFHYLMKALDWSLTILLQPIYWFCSHSKMVLNNGYQCYTLWGNTDFNKAWKWYRNMIFVFVCMQWFSWSEWSCFPKIECSVIKATSGNFICWYCLQQYDPQLISEHIQTTQDIQIICILVIFVGPARCSS